MNKNVKNVLITGGAGFIGSNLALRLLNKGYEITVLDNLSPQIHGNNPDDSYTYSTIKGKVRFVYGDVNDVRAWKEALANIDLVVHLAAETGTGQSMYEVKRYVDANIGGTATLLNEISNGSSNIKKVIIASSRSVYGEGKYFCGIHGDVYPISRSDADMSTGDFEVKCPICHQTVQMLSTDEGSKLQPTSVYGYTKLVQEQLGMIVAKASNVPLVALRFQNVYGPGQSLNNPYTGILSIFSTRIRNGNDINVFEDGMESRDFVYIDDVIDAICLSIENEKASYQILNVGSGIATTVLTVAENLVNLYGSNVSVKVSGNYRLGDIRHNIANITKAKELIGYAPLMDFQTGIKHFVNWVKTQETNRDSYEKSIEEMKAKGLFKL